MAAAGAKLGETVAPAAGAVYTIKSLGVRPARSSRRTIAVAAAAALVVVGGVAVAAVGQLAGHPRHPGAAQARALPSAVPIRSALARPHAVPMPAQSASAASPGRGPGAAASLQVVGVGCPGGGNAVTLDNASAGPGWTPAGGGWSGDGCDGSTLWTMDPNGKQPVPSSLTWRFNPTPGALRCTLAVFVPTQNALGVSDYSVSNGPLATGQVIAAVPVNQAAAAGHWLTLGTFPVSGSALEITAAPVSGAPGPGHHGAIAASAARASCT